MRTIYQTAGHRYSKTEIRDIAVSVSVLSVTFAVALHRGSNISFLTLIGISAVIVVLSFVVHELAHKFTAQRYGAWAEYRMFPAGLMIALMLSFTGLIFAAPGAVYISGNIDGRMNGKISAAGPASNIVLGAFALTASYITSGLMSDVFFIMAMINAFLALFNMIPVRPFDGSKIYRWSVLVYAVMLAASAALLVLVWL